jgi:predicted HTH domain antitoxin
LIRRRDEAQHRERIAVEIKRLKADTFTAIAERLWMDLGWLATELEKRRVEEPGG